MRIALPEDLADTLLGVEDAKTEILAAYLADDVGAMNVALRRWAVARQELAALVEATDLRPDIPRLAFTREEAARSLGISLDSFERYVQPHIRLIRRGKLRLVPVKELEAWVERNATGPVG